MNIYKSLLIIMAICLATKSQAQIWKKLGNKAEKAVERTLEKKVEQKAEKETNKAFDSTFNNTSKGKKSKSNKNSSIPFSPSGMSITPESTYRFSHKYVLEMTSDKKTTEIIYYLNTHGDYTGSTIPDTHGTNLINVLDAKRKTIFMFMENNGAKQVMSMKMNIDFETMADEAVTNTDYTVKPTGKTKTILGYNATEYETKGKDMHGTVWITNDVDVSLYKALASQKTKLKNQWIQNINGLMLEMSITDTSKRKPKTITMTCKALEKQNITIDSSQYKKMF